MSKVKICGITNLSDARVAVDAGADAFGLVFAESPRHVSPETARDILRALGKTPCVPVGVFVDELPSRIVAIAEAVGFRVIQLHGDESPDVVVQLRARGFDVVKSFRIATHGDLAALSRYEPDAFLLDAFVQGKAGGTGRTLDWRIARDAGRLGLPRRSGAKSGRIILSGGLGPDNVEAALRIVQPYGVDASSRLELSPGRKDPAKVRDFIRLAKSPGAPADAAPWPR